VAEEKNQLAIGQVLKAAEASDPEAVRRVHARLLDSMELTRLAEEHRRGKRLRLVHLGHRLSHGGRVLECRANMVEYDPADPPQVGEDRIVRGLHGPEPDRTWRAEPPDVSAGQLD
jgi:hypothetical protein